jgi:hypothetical protein
LKGKLKFDAGWWKRDQAADAEIEKSTSIPFVNSGTHFNVAFRAGSV